MPRVYYSQDTLMGKPFINSLYPAIASNFLQKIFLATSTQLYRIESKTYKVLGFIPAQESVFKYIQVNDDNIFYDSSEKGRVYLPRSICLYDQDECAFPNVFICIVWINDVVEIRQRYGGEQVKWHETMDNDKPVLEKDGVLLRKINTTLERLLEKIYADKKAQAEREEQQRIIEEQRPFISAHHQMAYLQLAKYSANPKKQAALKKFFGELKNYDENSEYGSTFYYVLHHLDEKKINFFIHLDWRAGLDDLEYFLKKYSKANFSTIIDFTVAEGYSPQSSISEQGVLRAYDQALRAQGLALLSIETGGDDYALLLCLLPNEDAVKQAIAVLDFKLLDWPA
jgi:hypothetical protein